MKICADCKYSKKDFVQVAQNQMAPMLFCTHEECRDPVEGSALPANISRQQLAFCGLPAKYYEAKEIVVKAEPAADSNLIQLK